MWTPGEKMALEELDISPNRSTVHEWKYPISIEYSIFIHLSIERADETKMLLGTPILLNV